MRAMYRAVARYFRRDGPVDKSSGAQSEQAEEKERSPEHRVESAGGAEGEAGEGATKDAHEVAGDSASAPSVTR